MLEGGTSAPYLKFSVWGSEGRKDRLTFMYVSQEVGSNCLVNIAKILETY